jgi:O-antigen ligase
MTVAVAPTEPERRFGTTTRPGPGPRPLPVWWLTAIALPMMVASDYDWRVRSVAESLSGAADIAVLLEIAVYGVCGVVLIALWAHARDRRAWPLLYVTGAWVVIMVASALYAPYPQLAIVRGAQLGTTFLLCVVIVRRGRRADLHLFAHAFAVMVVASIGLGIVVHDPPLTSSEIGRFRWLDVHPVVAGAYIALAFVIFVSYAARAVPVRRWPREAYVLGALICAIALLANHSRGSVIAGGLGAIVALFAPMRDRGRRDGALVLVLIALVAALLFGGTVVQFFDRGDSTAYKPSIESREKLYEEAWRFVQERPFTGYGLTAARGLFFDEIRLGGGHNAVINVVVEAGVAGLLWWLVVVVSLGVALRRLFRAARARADAALLMSVYVCLVVNGMTIEGMGAPANGSSIWLFVLVAWAIVWRRDLADTVTDREAPIALPVRAAPAPRRAYRNLA